MTEEKETFAICASCGCFAAIYGDGLCGECYECEIEKINNQASDFGSEYDSDAEDQDFYSASVMQSQSKLTQNNTPSISVSSYKCTRDDLVCPICLEKVKTGEDITSLPCVHTFHYTCISTWLHKNPRCPVCRTAVSE